MKASQLISDIKSIFRPAMFMRAFAVTFSDSVSILFALIIGTATTAVLDSSYLTPELLPVFFLLLLSVPFLNPVLLYLSNKMILKYSIRGDEYLLKQVLNEQPSVISSHDSGELSSKLIDDGIKLRWALIDLFVYSAELIFMFFIFLLFVLKINLFYTCFILGLTLLNYLKSRLSASMINKCQVQAMQAEQSANHLLYESAADFDFLYVNGLTELAICKISENIHFSTKTVFTRKIFTETFWTSFNQFLDSLFYVLILLFGLFLVKTNHIEIGVVLTMSYYYSILSHQFQNIDQISQAAATRDAMVTEILAVTDEPHPAAVADFRSLTINPLVYEQNNFRLVFDKQVQIHKGEKIAIIGKNGDGKTTLLYLILGLLCHNENEILLNDMPARAETLRGITGYVDMAADLLGDSVASYLCANTDKDPASDSLTDTFALSAFISSPSEILSGGERKRTDFVRVFLEDRPILAFDEPEVYLDSYWKEQFIQQLKSSDKTVIYTTHDASFIQLADQVISI